MKNKYSKMFTKNNKQPKEQPTQEEVIEQKIENKEINGVVDNCEKLYLRKSNSKAAEPLRILNKGTEVKILDDSDDIFYHVEVEAIKGYCVKEFIKVSE